MPFIRLAFVCLAFVCLLSLFLAVSVQAQNEAEKVPSMQQIIQISKQHARQAKVLHWVCSRKDGTYRDESQITIEALDSRGAIATFEVLFDPISLKYNVRARKTVRWIDGTSDYVSIDLQHGFDGTSYQGWAREKEGRAMPTTTTAAHGQISNDLSDLTHDAHFFSGLKGFAEGNMPGVPGFILTSTYSYYGMERIGDVFERWEKEKRIDSIKAVDGKIEITATVEILQGSTDFFLRVIYDPATDTIEHGTVFSRFQGKEHVMDIYEVTFRVNEQGVRVPKTSKIIMPLDKRAIIVSYDSFRFEENLPNESFQVAFPDGTLAVSVQAQNEAEKVPSLQDAKTVQDVRDWFQQATEAAGEKYNERERSFAQAGQKMLELADADVNAKVEGFRSLVAIRRMGIHGNDDYDRLWLFLDKLEEAGKYPDIVARERYLIFTDNSRFISSGTPREEALRQFERTMERAKQWANSPPPNITPIQPIQFILGLADSHYVREVDPDLLRRTIGHLLEFAQSDEMTADTEAKKKVIDLLQKFQLFQIGSDPKLYGKTLDNKDFDWKSLRGKYVLIKFTATWCGPCRAEIPGMLEAYAKYHDKGFEIVSIYISERGDDPVASVRKSVEDAKLPWIILSEALTERAEQPRQLHFYAIRTVPTMVLVDKEGKVVMTRARGDELKAKLAEIFE